MEMEVYSTPQKMKEDTAEYSFMLPCLQDTVPGEDPEVHGVAPGGDEPGGPDPRSSLPLPTPSQCDYSTVLRSSEISLVDPYGSVEMRSSGIYTPMHRADPGTPLTAGQSVPGKDKMYKMTLLLFTTLWIITLISLVATLHFCFQQSSTIKTEMEPQKMISDQQSAAVRMEMELRKMISELQMEVEDLDHFYSPRMMCTPNNSNPATIDQMSAMSKKHPIIIKSVWKWIQEAAVNVTLDPDTAHPKLVLSKDKKKVRLGPNRQVLRDTPERFNYVVCVLGKQGITSGRHYWEIEVKSKTDWTIGVALGNSSRHGKILFDPQEGFWTVRLKDGKYFAQAEDTGSLLLTETPRTVGVYVDYDGGQVSFYNVEARSQIYSFMGYTFTGKIYPLFRPGLSDNGKNTAPLIISPTKHTG
ncbi:erythroid membrane-associated protein-like [Megalops cyprinoides]|uniref:erythroid membrane-associated protein-like n=1 Tax=Megalops cyprinoides TaxID=118141 RepID=UPI001864A6C4|nr:erythroid membrane-associated protein-like [Megalops cyprinoides]